MDPIPVFLICDDNYSPYMATMIASVCNHTESRIEFHVIGKGISPENRARLEGMQRNFPNFDIDYRICDPSGQFGIPYLSLSRMTLSTYIRMLFPELFPEIDRALIMDVDILALGDIEQLWRQSLDGHIFAAALDGTNPDEPQVAYEAFKQNLAVKEDCLYANCGVMLIDCRKWREKGISQQCLAVEKEYRDCLECADQDVINKVFHGNFKVLDSRFNSLLGEEEDIVIRHFCWLRKPWISKYNAVGDPIRHFGEWWKHAAMTPFYPELKSRFDRLAEAGDNATPVRTRAVYERMEKIAHFRNLIRTNNLKNE